MTDYTNYDGGWVDDQEAVQALMAEMPDPMFASAASVIVGSGRGKVALLHEIFNKVFGFTIPIINQGSVGSCVAAGTAGAIEALKAADIYIKGDREEYGGLTSIEDIYGGSRVQIGGGRIRGDGSLGIWAAKYVTQYGTLVYKQYPSYNLDKYSESRCRQWGKTGTPKELLTIAKEHPIDQYKQVKSYEEVRDSVVNGYPVIIASNQGFSNQRDSEGFARPKGSWAHLMYVIAVDDKHGRKGALIMNSWGPRWNRGPKRHNQPDGSFWVDASVITAMCRRNDSWSLCGIDGYQKRDFEPRWF